MHCRVIRGIRSEIRAALILPPTSIRNQDISQLLQTPEISNVATGLGLFAHDVFNPLLMVNTELPSPIFHLTIYCLQELGYTIENTIKM